MMRMTDGRQSAAKVELLWHCHKLRLSNGKAFVVTHEWWANFLLERDPEALAAVNTRNEMSDREYLAECARRGVA